jgi:hypothetical protein
MKLTLLQNGTEQQQQQQQRRFTVSVINKKPKEKKIPPKIAARRQLDIYTFQKVPSPMFKELRNAPLPVNIECIKHWHKQSTIDMRVAIS